jgi:hypothetical protein
MHLGQDMQCEYSLKENILVCSVKFNSILQLLDIQITLSRFLFL